MSDVSSPSPQSHMTDAARRLVSGGDITARIAWQTDVCQMSERTLQAARLAWEVGDHDRYVRLMDRLEIQIASCDQLGLGLLSLTQTARG